MSTIRPPNRGEPLPPLIAAPLGPHPERGSSKLLESSPASPEGRAARAETSSRERVQAAEQIVKEEQYRSAQQIDRLKDDFVRESEQESIRSEAAIASQKSKGYEMLRDLKLAQQLELARTKKEGDRELQKLSTYYRDSIYNTERHGDEELGEVKRKTFLQTEGERNAAGLATESSRAAHHQQVAELKENTDESLRRISASAHQEFERMQKNTLEATEASEKRFEEQYGANLDRQNAALSHMERSAARKLEEIRADTAAKLSAYSSRQKDPFYKLVDIGAELRDGGDHYELSARIPTHEQAHVKAVIKGNNIVLSGYRRNEEKLEVDPGHMKGTSAYQSYEETFPLPWPVEAKGVTQEFRGEEFIVRVAKKNMYAVAPAKPTASRAKLERPQFPDNLPHVEPERVPNPDDPPTEPSKPTRGGRTLALG